jgi:hypothetical protein
MTMEVFKCLIGKKMEGGEEYVGTLNPKRFVSPQ